jgi:RimJ/RimL family protein N-acetyltransferase
MVDYILGDKVSNWKTADRPTGQQVSGKQVTLQRLVPGDAEGLFGELDKAEGEHDWNYMPFGPFETAATLRDWITSVVDSSDVVFYTMRRRADDLPFGFCSFLNIKPEGGSIEVGFIQVAANFQRSALFTEAMFLMAEHAFSLGYRRYEWKCDALNERSRRAAHRLGFSYEGKFRQALIVKGRNRDTKWFSIIDSEWSQISRVQTAWLAASNFDNNGVQKQSLSTMIAPLVKDIDPDLPPVKG